MTTRSAIITGGTRGFGRALAESLAADGWHVVVDGRTPVTMSGIDVVTGDVTDAAHRHALLAAAGDRLDVLVNNASTLGPTPLPRLADLPIDAIGEVFRTNAGAARAIVQQALPLLRSTPDSAIVNVTSDAAVEAYEGWGIYGASKAALEQLGSVLAAEEPHLRVWSFDPGDMGTQMHQDAFPGEDIGDRPLPEDVAVPALRRLLADRPPSGRVRAGDLAAAST